jgi:pimeloyl-ACP methyl ester carboxylesterase
VAVKRVNGVELFYEVSGAGEPLVLVHGSWGDHHNWDPVVAPLSESFKVVVYDRRGHSRSERPAGQGSVYDDADDLAALIEALEPGPAHVVGNSFGSIVAMNAAIRHPEVFATLVAHEPPLLGMLAGTRFEPALEEVNRRVGAVIELLAAGEDEAGAKLFVETVAPEHDRAVHRSSQALRRGRSHCLAASWWWRREGRAVTCNRCSPPPWRSGTADMK